MPDILRIVLVIALTFIATIRVDFAMAVEPEEVLANPVLEERARAVSGKLRCLVCQNQNIDSSDAPLAKDLRVLVRERLVDGDTNQQVLDYVVDRYGEFVLLQPRFGWHTLALWVTPVFALLAGFIFLFQRFRKSPRKSASALLSEAETKKLNEILND